LFFSALPSKDDVLPIEVTIYLFTKMIKIYLQWKKDSKTALLATASKAVSGFQKFQTL